MFNFLLHVICAILCFKISTKIELNEWVGAFIGFFGGLYGLAIYIILGVVYVKYIKRPEE